MAASLNDLPDPVKTNLGTNCQKACYNRFSKAEIYMNHLGIPCGDKTQLTFDRRQCHLFSQNKRHLPFETISSPNFSGASHSSNCVDLARAAQNAFSRTSNRSIDATWRSFAAAAKRRNTYWQAAIPTSVYQMARYCTSANDA